MTGKLIALWLYSAVFWSGHGADPDLGWYNHWSYENVGDCTEVGVVAVRDGWAEAFICQPENFPRPEPVAEAK